MSRLQKMKDHTYNMIKISFNSEGRIMTRKELNPMIHQIIMNKLNYALEIIGDTENNNKVEIIKMRDELILTNK